MLNNRTEKRKCQRFDFTLSSEFSLDSEYCDKVYTDVVANISLPEIGTHLSQPLEQGQNVTFKNSPPIETSDALLLWTKQWILLLLSSLKSLDRVVLPDCIRFSLKMSVNLTRTTLKIFGGII